MIPQSQIKTMGKAQLRELVKPISRRYASAIINEVIAKQRGVPLSFAKNQKIVFQKEVRIILDFLGLECEEIVASQSNPVKS
ncbi:hypothetical protein U8527_03145 [Kordia algicida OT-1]|uniref:Uncharacterized protein n=1 Tax=Kordia algicida OT-1 TaxID=391587 RepID=A9DNY5_9FLAO|nr:hypothetical protein [Kordia algicida]EDP97313.1 hypothetical protein KAOT1_19162 [Kordia algicida OT-1]